MLPESELQKALLRVPLISAGGPWTRAIAHHLLQGPPPGGDPGSPPQPLWPGGPVLVGARFTPKGSFGSIYLASDPATALEEVGAIFDPPDDAPSRSLRTPPWTVFAVEGWLEGVLDLTNQQVQRLLGTSLAELTGDWRYSQTLFLRGAGPVPPTQLLGRLAYETGRIAAVQYCSARRTGRGLGLVVFADRLVPSKAGVLEVYDPHGLIRQRLP